MVSKGLQRQPQGFDQSSLTEGSGVSPACTTHGCTAPTLSCVSLQEILGNCLLLRNLCFNWNPDWHKSKMSFDNKITGGKKALPHIQLPILSWGLQPHYPLVQVFVPVHLVDGSFPLLCLHMIQNSHLKILASKHASCACVHVCVCRHPAIKTLQGGTLCPDPSQFWLAGRITQ